MFNSEKLKNEYVEELQKIVGEGWIRIANPEDISSFFYWARKTGVYVPVDRRTGDAFRGFIKACEIKDGVIKRLDARVEQLELELKGKTAHAEVMEHKAKRANELLRKKGARKACFDGAQCEIADCQICGSTIHLDEPDELPVCKECYTSPADLESTQKILKEREVQIENLREALLAITKGCSTKAKGCTCLENIAAAALANSNAAQVGVVEP